VLVDEAIRPPRASLFGGNERQAERQLVADALERAQQSGARAQPDDALVEIEVGLADRRPVVDRDGARHHTGQVVASRVHARKVAVLNCLEVRDRRELEPSAHRVEVGDVGVRQLGDDRGLIAIDVDQPLAGDRSAVAVLKQPTPPRTRTVRRYGVSRPVLFVAFAFAVMADPVSSVAYTIEASLRSLNGHLDLLLATQIIVLGIIALVDVNYWQLVGRYPLGGGSAEAASKAFGTGWVFVPIGALIVDFVLTIAISVAAGGSALIAYFPALAPARIALGMALLLGVAALTWFGHGGRLIFAAMTLVFVASAAVMLTYGFLHPSVTHGRAPITGPTGPAVIAVLLSFPVAMALATGTEAPSTAIGQLGQLGAEDRRKFARGTLVLTLVLVAALTIAITELAVRLHVGIPRADSTQIADVAHAAVGNGVVYALFQATSALLLLAAASSSFQAGPGLLKALSRHPKSAGVGILPRTLGTTNAHHTPYWSVVVYLVVSAVVVLAAGGHEQELVLVYAVAVFVSFLAGLSAMARFSLRERRPGLAIVNIAGAVAVAFTLAVNLARGYPLLSLAAMFIIAATLYAAWVRQGRPSGVEDVELLAEADC
jgi:hypothetical protein